MSQTVTVEIPEQIFQRLEKRAHAANRSVEAEIIDAAAAAVSQVLDPDDLAASLALLDDKELWRAARSRLPAEVNDRIQELNFKQQREKLTAEEKAILADGLNQCDHVMLTRALAASLLLGRGHDVSSLAP